MKVIIPVAGKGVRLRPLTDTTPKPMLSVAGKPIIDHIVDAILPMQPTEIIFVTGYLREKIESHIKEKYSEKVKVTFVEQKEQRGTADAVWYGKAAFDEDVLIDFGDTIFETDLSIINENQDDAIIWVKKVDNPERFGVLITDEQGYMKRMVEKPKEFVSDLANIGLYYVKNTQLLAEGIEKAINNAQPGKEIYLTEAFQYMLDKGAKIKTAPVEGWFDCGTVADLKETDKILRSQ